LRHFLHPHDYSCAVDVDCRRSSASLDGAEPHVLEQLNDILDKAYADGVINRNP